MLRSFPFQQNVLSVCGLGQTVRGKLQQGADKNLRLLLAALLRHWDATTPGKSPSTANGAANGAASRGGTGAVAGAAQQAATNGHGAAFVEDEEPSLEILEAEQAAERVSNSPLENSSPKDLNALTTQ